MHALVFCAAGGAAALLMADYVGAGTGLVGAALSGRTEQAVVVDRSSKGDRLSPAVPARAAEPKIATVEVVGLEQAAIIYRDRAGRVLFHTDPMGNSTVVVRGVTLPEVTVRETSRTAVQPVMLPQRPPAAAEQPVPAKSPEPTARKPRLPDGCEPMVSPLAGAGIAEMTGRCVAQLGAGSRLALL